MKKASPVSQDTLTSVRTQLGIGSVRASEYIRTTGQLSPAQVRVLRAFLRENYDYRRPGVSKKNDSPVFTYEVLVDIRTILGRWLRPTEVRDVFGNEIKIFSRLFKIMEGDEDDEEEEDDVCNKTCEGSLYEDPRIRYIIGRKGSVLHSIVHRSDCLHVWIQNRKAATIYAAGTRVEDAEKKILAAARMMNAAWKAYAGSDKVSPEGRKQQQQVQRSSASAASLAPMRGEVSGLRTLRLTSTPGSHTMQVSIKTLYKAISQR